MKNLNILVALAGASAMLLSSQTVSAQSLDPTVNVTRNMQLKALESEKPSLSMAVPDSVTRFNLDFDYSVLSKPYQGAYEFTPYALEMRPQPDAYREKKLWVRAGAGYTLHPTFDLVWSPLLTGRFRMGVYANHNSYVGGYRNTGTLLNSGSRYSAWESDRTQASSSDPSSSSKARRNNFYGYDLLTNIGTDGRFSWDGGSFTYDVSYLGIATKDSLSFKAGDGTSAYSLNTRHYDALNLEARVRSVKNERNYFFYDAAIVFRYGVDQLDYNVSNSAMLPNIPRVNETLFKLDTEFGPVIAGEHAVLIGVDGNVAAYGQTLGSHVGNLVITPRYCYSSGRFNVRAGVRIDIMKRPSAQNELLGTAMNYTKGQVVYPDVDLNFGIIREAMDMYLRVGGGNNINPYSDVVLRNHFFSVASLCESLPLLDNTVERVSAKAGFRGRIGIRFSYDVNGGWLYNANAPLEALASCASDVAGYFPTLVYNPYQCAFASLRLGLDTNPFNLNAWLDYKWTDVWSKGLDAIEPSRLVGGLRAEYNWNRRIVIGLDCEGSVNRRGHIAGAEVYVPWYVDLGLDAEYRFNKGVSLWIRGGNLLNQTIQRTVGYAENGINCTVGISFVL